MYTDCAAQYTPVGKVPRSLLDLFIPSSPTVSLEERKGQFRVSNRFSQFHKMSRPGGLRLPSNRLFSRICRNQTKLAHFRRQIVKNSSNSDLKYPFSSTADLDLSIFPEPPSSTLPRTTRKRSVRSTKRSVSKNDTPRISLSRTTRGDLGGAPINSAT